MKSSMLRVEWPIVQIFTTKERRPNFARDNTSFSTALHVSRSFRSARASLASLLERLTIRKAMPDRIAFQKDFVRNHLMRRFRQSHGFGHRFQHSAKIAVGRDDCGCVFFKRRPHHVEAAKK